MLTIEAIQTLIRESTLKFQEQFPDPSAPAVHTEKEIAVADLIRKSMCSDYGVGVIQIFNLVLEMNIPNIYDKESSEIEFVDFALVRPVMLSGGHDYKLDAIHLLYEGNRALRNEFLLNPAEEEITGNHIPSSARVYSMLSEDEITEFLGKINYISVQQKLEAEEPSILAMFRTTLEPTNKISDPIKTAVPHEEDASASPEEADDSCDDGSCS